MTDGIANKVILITGGSTGIGAETARLLASRGAKVAIAARRKDKLDTVVAEIAAGGGEASAYTLDVTDKAQVATVVADVVADFGGLDVLINNAGLMPIRPMAEANTDEWDAMIDVNLKGTLYGIAAALPRFLAQNSGHIINLSSVAGIKVFAPGGTVYSGTKFAVSAITEGLRQEVGETVRVTAIEPGAVESDLKLGTSGTATGTVMDFYRRAIPASSVARAIAYAIEQPTDVAKAQRIARRLETGGVFINGFSASNARITVGGVKKSGYGRELSHFGLREFTNAQSVWAKAHR